MNFMCKIISTNSKKIQKISSRKNDCKMTLMKAFGIIAVVASHCGGGALSFSMQNWVSPYFYFMPLFVFVSGYLYKQENDDLSVLKFVFIKFKSLVVPYFIWNVFYGLANAIFKYLGVINHGYGDPINLHSLFLRPWVDGHQFVFNIPSWFMLSLFIDTILIFLLRKFLKKLKILNEILILIITVAVSLVSIAFAQKGYNYSVYLCFIKAGYMLPFFALGYICKKHAAFITKYRTYAIMLLLAAIVVMCLFPVGAQVVFAKFTGNPLIIVALTAACLVLVSLICEILVPAFSDNKIIAAIGNNTYSIMMHHAFVIFLINLGIYIMSKFFDIDSFDVQSFRYTIWYCCDWLGQKNRIVYLLLATFVPVLFKITYSKIILFLDKKINSSSMPETH